MSVIEAQGWFHLNEVIFSMVSGNTSSGSVCHILCWPGSSNSVHLFVCHEIPPNLLVILWTGYTVDYLKCLWRTGSGPMPTPLLELISLLPKLLFSEFIVITWLETVCFFKVTLNSHPPIRSCHPSVIFPPSSMVLPSSPDLLHEVLFNYYCWSRIWFKPHSPSNDILENYLKFWQKLTPRKSYFLSVGYWLYWW